MYESSKVAGAIKSVAKSRGIQLKNMWLELGLNKSTLSNMYKGSMLNGDSLARIADYLNCSVDYLLGRTDEPSLISNVIGGDVTGGTVLQGTHQSSVVIHDGSKRVLSKECAELVSIYEALDVRQRIRLLNAAFEIADGSVESQDQE